MWIRIRIRIRNTGQNPDEVTRIDVRQEGRKTWDDEQVRGEQPEQARTGVSTQSLLLEWRPVRRTRHRTQLTCLSLKRDWVASRVADSGGSVVI
jgi:hypothetical protein